MHCHTALGRCVGLVLQCTSTLIVRVFEWALELLPCTLTLLGGRRKYNCWIAVPNAWGQWAVDFMQGTASPPRGSGQGRLAMDHHTTLGQLAVEIL